MRRVYSFGGQRGNQRLAFAATPAFYGSAQGKFARNRTNYQARAQQTQGIRSRLTRRYMKMSSIKSPTVENCLELFRKAVPALDGVSYKGQAGRIAVVGGSTEYTGAPYFAAMAAMRGGAELSSVYCAESAAPAIKSYSPDLIVYPGFDTLGDDCKSLDRIHAIILGPGLGRSETAAAVVDKVVSYVCRQPKPLVIDADGLWFIAKSHELREKIRNGPPELQITLTPNKVEMDRLQKAMNSSQAENVGKWFQGRVVLVGKGSSDQIFGENSYVEVSNAGSLKRVGGQGDFLAGLIALCSAWISKSTAFQDRASPDHAVAEVAPAVCGCVLTRTAAHRAFLKHGRSLLASDMLPSVGQAVHEVLAGSSSE
ncbi:unnamed protein product [Chondrus crispus]|uniref:ATP-dependent (S)-NAD(P)H-hydrate dehydratase n=1 Tax=Chondrus crispus TaxID=2769 RepID=R7Q760_CHOCR|nr:unnamed protein product [Chondrus crispus]CDF33859.1 unnamed protein product [Chondrus crispus]|eukprot:XP_005713678.1 unnamed protein product [Chondrus crispus]